MSDRRLTHGRVSFLVWLAEVDAVIAEAARIGAAADERLPAAEFRRELEVARATAEQRLLARKAFHFEPSAHLAGIAKRAIDGARRDPPPTLGALG